MASGRIGQGSKSPWVHSGQFILARGRIDQKWSERCRQGEFKVPEDELARGRNGQKSKRPEIEAATGRIGQRSYKSEIKVARV